VKDLLFFFKKTSLKVYPKQGLLLKIKTEWKLVNDSIEIIQLADSTSLKSLV
jgi:hypothetical protein